VFWKLSGMVQQELDYSVEKKNRPWRRYKTTGSVYDFETFKSLRRCFKADVAAVYREYVRRVNNDIKTDPKKFWSFLNSKNNSSSIPASMVYNNATITDPQIIVDSFADHFSKSFTRDAASTLSSASLPYDNLTLTRVSDDDVLKAIKCLKPNMTSGPDEIPSLVIRDCAAVFADPLCFLFNLILNTSCYPMRLKTSAVRPIHKKDDRSEITNYRPIALISNFAKVFEYVLYNSSLHYVSHKLPISESAWLHKVSVHRDELGVDQSVSI
jgi:hypothetical protein